VEVGTEEGLSIKNQEDWDDFGKKGEEEDLEFGRNNLGDFSTSNSI